LFGAAGWKGAVTEPGNIEKRLTKRAELLFYRTAEIRARAEKVEHLRPDLTLCIHYNAAPWPTPPKKKDLVSVDRLVVFVHGAYLPDEVAYEDIRFDLIRKVLEQSAKTELHIAEAVAEEMGKTLRLPPETYANWTAVKRVGKNPYVFARNLIANRIFPGPVVFVEGPYMNAAGTYARLIAGDYEGYRTIDGVSRRSIHRDYADAVVAGVSAYFKARANQPAP
jgi:hypothetical protein